MINSKTSYYLVINLRAGTMFNNHSMDDLLPFDATERDWRLWDFRDLVSWSHLFKFFLHVVRGHVQF